MNLKKTFLVGGLMVTLIMAISAAQVFAGEGVTQPAPNETIIGPTMWAVGVVDCTNSSSPYATLRVKKIDDCVVDTQPVATANVSEFGLSSCPTSEAQVLYVRFSSNTFFDLPCEAIITKVKNFNDDNPATVSFDAQIQFVTTNPDRTECQ